jgi:carboxymethylenebutenolidase
MTSEERYLAEEVAVDYADGLLTRSEALRRLALMGLSGAAAASLLAAGRVHASPGAAAAAGADGADGDDPTSAVPTEPITFRSARKGVTLQGAWAEAKDADGGVLVIHENRGLTDHIRSVAGRLAGDGFSALAIDLLSEEGGTAALGGDAEAMAALSKVPPERFVEDMRSGLKELRRRVRGERLGAIGFCFGGGMVWRLIASGDKSLRAAAPFYGPLPDGADFSGSRAAVLAVYAELDTRVNASRDAAIAALEAADLDYHVETFPGVNHAFFNDTGPRYDAAAARKAYRMVLRWWDRYLDD